MTVKPTQEENRRPVPTAQLFPLCPLVSIPVVLSPLEQGSTHTAPHMIPTVLGSPQLAE